MAVLAAYGFHQHDSNTDIEASAVQIGGGLSDISLRADIAGEGAQSLTVGGDSWVAMPIASDPGASWVLHFWIEFTDWPVAGNSGFSLALTDVSSNLGINIAVENSSHDILVRRGTTILHTFDGSNNTPYNCRLKVTEHATEGTIEFWVDGNLVYSAEDIDTSRTSAFTADRIRFGAAIGGGGGGRHCEYSHVILTDGEDLGDGALVAFFAATADVAPNEYTKSDAGLDHYEHLDDVPNNGDTDYLGSDAAAEKTRHTCSVSLSDRRIVAARPALMARLEAAGNDRLKITTESGEASPVEDTLEDFDTAYKASGGAWQDTDPDTTEEWTEAGLSALEIEVEHLAPEA